MRGLAAKRRKVASATAGAAAQAAEAGPIIRPSLLEDPQQRADLAKEYSSGQPYPHCVIPDVFDPARLLAARNEIIHNLRATYKETDLFKMLQTGDLANIDQLDADSAAKLPNLLALRDALYASDFREFVTAVTGCGDLSDETDCACNIHPLGGHLLCHDDVIGDRRVSYIVYLTDPEEPWTAEDGGALELYPEDPAVAHTPAVAPAATVLPAWNSVAMFTVQPGRSFHAIQEVMTAEKPRMSIQGWFHAPAAPEDAQLATLRQLQARPGEQDEGEYTVVHSTSSSVGLGEDLTEDDRSLLADWINPAYLRADAAAKVVAQFEEEGSVQLRNFLRADHAAAISAATAAADAAAALGSGRVPSYDAGVGAGWSAVGPPHKQRYLQFAAADITAGNAGGVDTTEAAEAGRLLEQVRAELFQSAAFARLLRHLTSVVFLGQRSQVRRFRPGLDYSVAHYGGLTKDPRLDAVLCFVAGDEAALEAWDGGEVGAFEAYLLADEEEAGPAEVYRGGDDESGVLNVSAAPNTLNLVLRDEGLMRFVKYVSAQAPGSRWDVAGVFRPEDDSDDEEEEEQEEEAPV